RRGRSVLPVERLWENPPPCAQGCRRDAASRSTDRAARWTHPAWIGAMALAGFRSGVSALDSPVLVERSVAAARGAACRDRAASSPIRRRGDRRRRFRALGLDRPWRAVWIDPLCRRHRGAWRRQAAVPPAGVADGPRLLAGRAARTRRPRLAGGGGRRLDRCHRAERGIGRDRSPRLRGLRCGDEGLAGCDQRVSASKRVLAIALIGYRMAI